MRKVTYECDECGREDIVGNFGNGLVHYCSRHREEVDKMYQDYLDSGL